MRGSPNSEETVREARAIYESGLCSALESEHMNEFVAIEPISGEYFPGQTLSEAIGASRGRFPDRMAHAMRVGHHAAIHIGSVI